MTKYNKWFMAMPEYAHDTKVMDVPKEIWLRDGVSPVKNNEKNRCYSIFKIVDTMIIESKEMKKLFKEGREIRKEKSFGEIMEEVSKNSLFIDDLMK